MPIAAARGRHVRTGPGICTVTGLAVTRSRLQAANTTDAHQPRHVHRDQVRHQLFNGAALVTDADHADGARIHKITRPGTPFVERRGPGSHGLILCSHFLPR